MRASFTSSAILSFGFYPLGNYFGCSLVFDTEELDMSEVRVDEEDEQEDPNDYCKGVWPAL